MKNKIMIAVLTAAMALSLTGCVPSFKEAVKEEIKDAVIEVVEDAIEENMTQDVEETSEVKDSEATENETDESDASKEAGEETDDDSVLGLEAKPVENGEYTKEAIMAALPLDGVKLTTTIEGYTADVIINYPDMQIATTIDGIYSEVYFVDGELYSHTNVAGMDLWFKTKGAIADIDSNPAMSVYSENIEEFEYVETVEEDGITLDVVKVKSKTSEGKEEELTYYIDPSTGYAYKIICPTDDGDVTMYVTPGESFSLPADANKSIEVPLDGFNK